MATAAKKKRVEENPRPPEIDEDVLQEYLAQMQVVIAAKNALKSAQADFDKITETIKAMVEAGAVCNGELEALLVTVPDDTKPAWKTIALRYAERLKVTPGQVELDGAEEARQRRGTHPELVVQAKRIVGD